MTPHRRSRGAAVVAAGASREQRADDATLFGRSAVQTCGIGSVCLSNSAPRRRAGGGITSAHDIAVVGASAGGIEALTQLVSALPADYQGTLFVVVHISPNSPSMLPQILTRSGPLVARHPVDGEPLEARRI